MDNRTGSPADVNGVSERPVEGKSSKGVSHTTETSSVPLPSRSQRRHAATEESFERSVLLLIVILTLLGGVAVVAEITVSQEAPTPLLRYRISTGPVHWRKHKGWPAKISSSRMFP